MVTVADGEGTPIFFIGKPQCPSRGFQVVLSATPRGRRPRPPPTWNHGRMSPGGGDKGHLTVWCWAAPIRGSSCTWHLGRVPLIDISLHSHTIDGRMGSRTERIWTSWSAGDVGAGT